MERGELLKLINIKEEMIATNRLNRLGTIIKPTKITIHNTSNKSLGADAKLHSRFVRENGYYIIRNPQTGDETQHWVSWHYTVDDTIAIKQLPLNEIALHAGTQANNTSIAIEICMHSGINQEVANEKGAQLVALLCYDLFLPLTAVVTHNSWTGKNCPEILLKSWDDFKAKIDFYLKQLRSNEALKFQKERFGIPLSETFLCWNNENSAIHDDVVQSVFKKISNGFNFKFLECGEVTLPNIPKENPINVSHVFIHHQNLSIYFNKTRKLALYTACNFDKDRFIAPINRSNNFRDDRLIGSSFQLGDGFYGSKTLDKGSSQNYFDRGHLIARRYNQWGETEEEAKQGEKDTYYYTTIHPQVGELNQRQWEDLESFIIESGKLDVKRISIIAGAFLSNNDPIATYIDKYYNKAYKIAIPKIYWKIVFYEVDKELRRIAFLMSQKNRLEKLPMVKFKKKSGFLPDPFERLNDPLKTYVVKSDLIELETKLSFTKAKELYNKEEPLEILIKDNDVEPGFIEHTYNNILQFI